MKSSSDHAQAPGRKGRSRADRLEVAIIVNQLATPGLGSWGAGHRVAGIGQLVFSTSGFAAGVVHFIRVMRILWTAAWEGREVVLPDSRLIVLALVLFGIAWVWSGFTSLQMLREIRRLRAIPPGEPPRLD